MLNRHAMPNNDKKPFLFQMQQLYGTPTLQPYILSLLFSSPSARDKWRENNKLQALVLPPLFRVANAFAHSRDYTCFRLVSFLPYRPRISKIQFKGRYFMLRVRDKSVSHTLHTNFAGLYVNGNGTWESRTIRLYFTYRFGNNQIKSARQRQTSLDAESKRIK